MSDLAELSTLGGVSRDLLASALRAVLRAPAPISLTMQIDGLVGDLDGALQAQLDAILHAPAFVALEASWRGLAFAVDGLPLGANVQTAMLHARKDELFADVDEAPSLLHSALYRVLYTEQYGQFGGIPFAAVLLDHAFEASYADVTLLRALAKIGAMAHSVVLAAAAPALLGFQSFEELSDAADLPALRDDVRLRRYQELRALDESRYLGLLLPRFLLREPHGSAPGDRLVFEESAQPLWGNPVYAMGTRVAAAFVRDGWCVDIAGRSGGRFAPPAVWPDLLLDPAPAHPPLEVVLDEARELDLAELGLVVLSFDSGDEQLVFARTPSARLPRTFGGREGPRLTLDDRIGCQLPYVFLASRIAHGIKVFQRELLGAGMSASDLERVLGARLEALVVDMATVPRQLRAQHPLRRAELSVHDHPGHPGWYEIAISIEPHLRYLGAAFSLAVHGHLERT